MIHVDTSFLVRALVMGSHEDRLLRTWLAENRAVEVSAPAWAEYLCGPLDPADAASASAILGDAVPLTSAHAARAAAMFNASGRRRGTLMDCLIAACAVETDAAIATANPKDFERIPGVRLAETT